MDYATAGLFFCESNTCYTTFEYEQQDLVALMPYWVDVDSS